MLRVLRSGCRRLDECRLRVMMMMMMMMMATTTMIMMMTIKISRVPDIV